MKKLLLALGLLMGLGPATASAQELPDLSMYKMMLDANKGSGWVSFREYDGHQWIYFSALVTLRCRMKEVRYSLNSDALDQTFPLVRCIPAIPFAIPSDAGWEATAMRQPSQSVKTLSVQVVFDDDSESEIMTFAPCEGVGDMTCARVVN
ncbi:hypothetical protein [Maritalea porphyrae]|uniref:hypothetical protein n=1 Tax=Maritalea porphyrae TaxID=880732 RepID=UPI0022AE557C|nr:hypothetical protein [Maritalea porphyrae]MCZ4273673.1 hypothetical protein [Maritalea porphyrae]